MLPADQGLHPGGAHVAQGNSGLIGEEELVVLERFAQVHLEFHAVLEGVLHAGLKHHVAILTVPLGAVHRNVGIAQELLGRGVLAHGNSDARRHGQLSLLVRPELERLLERIEQALGDQLGTRGQRELLGDHDELVATEASQRIGVADHAIQPGGDRSQELIADAVAERVVDRLEVVEIDEQRRHRRLTAARAGEHLLDAVQDQCAVGEPGQRVVRRQEGKLLLTPLELLIGSPTLDLETLAHPHEAELEAQLQNAQGLGERLGRDIQLRPTLMQHLSHHVAPGKTATGHLVQRRRAVGRQLAKDLPGFAAGLDRHLNALPCNPARHRHRGAPTDPFEAALNNGVNCLARSRGSRNRQMQHILSSRLERLAKTTEILRGRLHQSRWRRREERPVHF